MKKLSIKGFTLIELLVVITIIGILATGATAVYTSAQQKARDSIRQNDLLAMRSAIEQSFGDNADYPEVTTIYSDVVGANYMQALPDDPKSDQPDNQTRFVYTYAAAQDPDTAVAGQVYELSANFENTGNATTKETNTSDGGNDENRWELGISMDTVNTDIDATDADCDGSNNYDGTGAVDCVTVDSINS
jgi:general secretion pathway protein G